MQDLVRKSGSGWLRAGGIVAIAVFLLFAAGCKDDEPSEEKTKERAEQEVDAGETDAKTMEEKRSAYGLPYPPKVRRAAERNGYVELTTRMELDDLAKFFRTRLVDYEILRPADDKIRVVGLRQFMPGIRGHRYGPVTTLVYFPKREKPEGEKVDAGDKEGEPSKQPRSDKEKRVPGTPVMTRTPSGELLAPGAKWGEPYTPPPGSPLHKDRYRANFGKPYGEWQLP